MQKNKESLYFWNLERGAGDSQHACAHIDRTFYLTPLPQTIADAVDPLWEPLLGSQCFKGSELCWDRVIGVDLFYGNDDAYVQVFIGPQAHQLTPTHDFRGEGAVALCKIWRPPVRTNTRFSWLHERMMGHACCSTNFEVEKIPLQTGPRQIGHAHHFASRGGLRWGLAWAPVLVEDA